MSRVLSYRWVWVTLSAGLVAVASSAAVTGCSGADAGDLFAGGDQDANTSPTQKEDSSSPDPSDGSTPPTGNENDASRPPTDDGGPGPGEPGGQDAGTPPIDKDSGTDPGNGSHAELHPTPGKVPCGPKDLCRTEKEVCCVSSPNQCEPTALPTPTPPQNNDDANDGGTCKTVRECDEKADCPDGLICCMNRQNLPATYCAKKCPNNQAFQVCETDKECGAGTCDTYDCKWAVALPLGQVNACVNPQTWGITCQKR